MLSKIKEFNGMKDTAFEVLMDFPEARFKKNILIYRMWQFENKGGSLEDFALAFIRDDFKVESMTRAARAVVELHPELGNPDRKKLAKQMKLVIKESLVDPGQIEIQFTPTPEERHIEFLNILQQEASQ